MGNLTGMTSVGGSTNNVALRLHARGTQDIFPMNPIEMVAVRYNVSECMHVILAPLENNTMANSYERDVTRIYLQKLPEEQTQLVQW